MTDTNATSGKYTVSFNGKDQGVSGSDSLRLCRIGTEVTADGV